MRNLRLQMGAGSSAHKSASACLHGNVRARSLVLVLFCAALLAACGDVGAPTRPGVCWRMTATTDKPRFLAISSGVASLDDCAAQLEAFHLQGQGNVAGAFQGYFIFIDQRLVASAPSLNGFRYPIFQPGQRREIDVDLRRLMADRNGALPSAGDLDVERR